MEPYKRLNSEERELISILLNAGYSFQEIGKLLKRHLSTISREVLPKDGRKAYRALPARSAELEMTTEQAVHILFLIFFILKRILSYPEVLFNYRRRDRWR